MHSEYRKCVAFNTKSCGDHAARFEVGNMDDIVMLYLNALAHQDGIAMPTYRVSLNVQRYRFVVRMRVDKKGG